MFNSVKLFLNESVDSEEIIANLDKMGYLRSKQVSSEGDYSLLGEILIIYPVTFEYPVRVDLSDGIIRSIYSLDLMSFRNIDSHNGVIILPRSSLRKQTIKKKTLDFEISGERPIDSFVDIEPGDFVVHVDYGVGKYLGLQTDSHKGSLKDYFVLQYQNEEKLYVEQKDLHKLQRYISFHRKIPTLNSLKGKKWAHYKNRAKSATTKIAQDLLNLQAKRNNTKAFAFGVDTDWQEEIEKLFPYKETPDQLEATKMVKEDMEKDKPMDRLLCGDVGYGKTEVALRAVFKAVMDNKQVAILVPTTILAEQHATTFKERFKDHPVNVQMLNRFRSKAEQKAIVDSLKKGQVDVVIGTHRILSDDIEFKDLGLLVIDEEQRFGVKQKEKIKRLRVNIDILTLTATPIPRTLYLALMGGKDISVIETPPLERQPVHTEVINRDRKKIKNAILKELARGGQVYYLHNRVDSIEKISKDVRSLVPEARIKVGHGQMSSKVLEKTMLNFIEGEIDVLVCTTIIESGIDIPNANTMIINEADKFGLADLYQLRGRIGRFDKKAYAYLIVRDMNIVTSDVRQRLEAIKKYQELGSGFKIAMRDLEMRGAGNVLGIEQSGFIDQIGFDLYCRLLKAEIERLKE